MKLKIKSTGKKKNAPIPKNDPAVKAQIAVDHFESARSELFRLKDLFSEEYPDAFIALESVKAQEDLVHEFLNEAKSRVAAAKTDIGEFKCTRAFSQAGYDESKFTDILMSMKNPGDLLEVLLKSGVIKSFKINKDAGNVFAAANPKLANPLARAWVDKEELTPRVSVPKL